MWRVHRVLWYSPPLKWCLLQVATHKVSKLCVIYYKYMHACRCIRIILGNKNSGRKTHGANAIICGNLSTTTKFQAIRHLNNSTYFWYEMGKFASKESSLLTCKALLKDPQQFQTAVHQSGEEHCTSTQVEIPLKHRF